MLACVSTWGSSAGWFIHCRSLQGVVTHSVHDSWIMLYVQGGQLTQPYSKFVDRAGRAYMLQCALLEEVQASATQVYVWHIFTLYQCWVYKANALHVFHVIPYVSKRQILLSVRSIWNGSLRKSLQSMDGRDETEEYYIKEIRVPSPAAWCKGQHGPWRIPQIGMNWLGYMQWASE